MYPVGLLKAVGRLPVREVKKISAVEGMKLTPRMATALAESRGKTGDERGTLVKEQLAKTKRK
jgi:hypothetical protein